MQTNSFHAKIFLKLAMHKGRDLQKNNFFRGDGHDFHFHAFLGVLILRRSYFTTVSYDNWFHLDHPDVLNSPKESLLVKVLEWMLFLDIHSLIVQG